MVHLVAGTISQIRALSITVDVAEKWGNDPDKASVSCESENVSKGRFSSSFPPPPSSGLSSFLPI